MNTSMYIFRYETPDTQSEGVPSDDLIEQAIERINMALAIVAGKASDTEIAEYKQFIYNCSVAAAEAAGKEPFGTASGKGQRSRRRRPRDHQVSSGDLDPLMRAAIYLFLKLKLSRFHKGHNSSLC